MPVELTNIANRNFGDSPMEIDLRPAAPHLSPLCGDLGSRTTIAILVIHHRTSNQFLTI